MNVEENKLASPIALSGLRGMIAQKMTESLTQTAQLTFFTDADCTGLVARREAFKSKGVKVGYEDLIIHTLVSVLRDFPTFNAIESDGQSVPQADINVGCAIALPGALVAPAIFSCQALSVEEIAEKRRDLVARAGKNRLSIAEQTSGTISITNLGLTRVRHFTPILNHPQKAIVALGQIVKKPWVDQATEEISVRPVMGLSLTVDHRFIDGAPAGEFLSALADRLEALG